MSQWDDWHESGWDVDADGEFDDERFELVRESLAPEFRMVSDDEIVGLFAEVGLDADDMEFNLGNALRSVGKVAQSIAPTVLPVAGTVLGTAFGGPIGGALGGTLGNMAGGALAPAPRRAASPPTSRARTSGGVRRTGARSATTGAASQLMQLLQRPEVLRALQSMALGRAGAPSVPVGRSAVPVGAFANLLGSLVGEMATEQHVVAAIGTEGMPQYLEAFQGDLDVSDPDVRASCLMQLLEQAARDDLAEAARGLQWSSEGWSDDGWSEWDDEWDEEDDAWSGDMWDETDDDEFVDDFDDASTDDESWDAISEIDSTVFGAAHV